MFKWACKAVGPEKGSEVSFSEYVHIVAYFSMFTRMELIKFLFGQMDPEQKGFLTKEGWEKFCDILAEEGPYNPSPWKKQFEAWYDKKLKMLFCAQFDKFSLSQFDCEPHRDIHFSARGETLLLLNDLLPLCCVHIVREVLKLVQVPESLRFELESARHVLFFCKDVVQVPVVARVFLARGERKCLDGRSPKNM